MLRNVIAELYQKFLSLSEKRLHNNWIIFFQLLHYDRAIKNVERMPGFLINGREKESAPFLLKGWVATEWHLPKYAIVKVMIPPSIAEQRHPWVIQYCYATLSLRFVIIYYHWARKNVDRSPNIFYATLSLSSFIISNHRYATLLLSYVIIFYTWAIRNVDRFANKFWQHRWVIQYRYATISLSSVIKAILYHSTMSLHSVAIQPLNWKGVLREYILPVQRLGSNWMQWHHRYCWALS